MPLVTGYGSDSDEEPLQSALQLAPATDVAERAVQVVVAGDDNKIRKNTAAFVERDIIDEATFKAQKRAHEDSFPRNQKKRRSKKGDPSDVNGYKGPWASYSESSESSEPEEEEEEEETKEQHIYGTAKEDVETTLFYGKAETDYLGRTYMHIPRDLDVSLTKEPGTQECFVPKKKLFVWEGHERGTQKLQFFPKSGHLLLSGGNDSKIFLWDVYHKRELLRGFYGHSKPVKDVQFNHDGEQFLSCSYDQTVKLWDVEKGLCVNRYKLRAAPNVVRYNTNENRTNEFVVGLSNNKIEHFDVRTNETVQTYDHHMAAVNDICFVNDGDRFMSSSDDKTVRVWGWAVNMPIKHISDPSQHSMPRLALHPVKNYVVAQSMDNTIVTFSAKDKYKRNNKKVFRGHSNAGHAIGLDFSPDGKILMSGDAKGYAYFWDWATCKLVTKLKVEDSPINCIQAHPQETSKVAMAGSKGKIYLYD